MHVKDLNKGKKGPVPAGDGIIDFKRIFANASVAGMKHFFEDHDSERKNRPVVIWQPELR